MPQLRCVEIVEIYAASSPATISPNMPAGRNVSIAGTPGFVLSHQAQSPADVDDILRKVLIAGGSVIMEGTQSEWGYSAYFEDTEGNVWELMAQPAAN